MANNTIHLDPEWYYSENDLSKILKKPVVIIREFIKDRNIPVRHMLNRQVVTGKAVNNALNNVDINKYKYQRQLNQLEDHKEYKKEDAIHLIGISSFKFNEQYINQYHLTPTFKNSETGTTFYKGSDINKITNQLISTFKIRNIYPAIISDERDYYTSQLTQNLGLTNKTFNDLYINKYQLKPSYTKKIKDISQPRIYYKGSDVNRITKLIREDYYHEM
ncbi:MAG: hypothetical protein E6618_12810 [Staphylococcus warneri]|nr:hypothetical protein [Staphylococcus warneri]